MRVTRSGSPRRAGSGSPPPRRPSCWCGRCMREWLRHKSFRTVLAASLMLAACSTTASPAPVAGLVSVTVQVPDELAGAPFDQQRQAQVPPGWTMSVWARVSRARLATWTPDGALLVSVPAAGQIMRLQPNGSVARASVLLSGLDQPHGMAFAGSTLYVAESDQID